MKLSDAGRESILELNTNLAAGLTVQGIGYDSTQVSGGGFTEMEGETGGLALQAFGYVGYWPGTFRDGQEFACFVKDETLEYMHPEQATVLCDQISELQISELALRRHEHRDKFRPHVQKIRDDLGLFLVPRIMHECVRVGNPFVYMSLGSWDVQSSEYGKSYGAVIHYPTGINPKNALANLKANAKL